MHVRPYSTRHPEVAAQAALEGRRPGSFILRGSLREHLRMTRSNIAQQNYWRIP